MHTLPSPLQLRHAMDGDAAFCRALYAATRDDLRCLPLPAAQREQLIAMQQHVHEAGQRAHFPNAEVLILEHDGLPAGRVVLAAAGPVWRLVDLAVLPAMRGRGLAGALLAALQERAAVAGAGIGLAVKRDNQPALRLYLHAGFSIVASNEVQHEMAWGSVGQADGAATQNNEDF